MVIRFLCPSCTQPIEIDAEWGGKLVACPYCRHSVTAPQTSTLPEFEAVPAAQPAATTCRGWGSAPAVSGPLPEQSTRILGLAAVMVAVLALVSGIVLAVVLAQHGKEFAQLSNPTRSFAENQREMMNYFQSRYGGFPGWAIVAGLAELGGAIFLLTAVVLGILALRGSDGRKLGIIALALCGLCPILCCSGFLWQ